MNYAELLLGQLPEAIFFPLFVIFCKGEKVKSKEGLLFIFLSIFQYLLLAYTFPFNSWFQFIYIFSLYIDCRFIWKDKSDIRDLFIIIGYMFYLLAIGILSFFIFSNYYVAVLFNRIFILISIIIISKNKKTTNLYSKYWNRDDKIKKKIKTITFRTIHIIIINILFFLINVCMIYSLYYINL